MNPNDIFGKIKPPPGVPTGTDPLGTFLTFGIRILLIAAGLTTVLYLFLGGFDFITSSGEKEKVSKAQEKIRNAIIGLILVITAFALGALFEQVVFKGRVCLGLTCAIKIPSIK